MNIIGLTKKFFVGILSVETEIARVLVEHAYKRLYQAEWFIPPEPEFFDHNINLYYSWRHDSTPHWVERGVYNLCSFKCFDKPEIVVELCCVDGFYTKNFYSTSCKKIYACDYDINVIKHARRHHNSENIVYEIADIRNGIQNIFKNISEGSVDVVVWDAAMSYFSQYDIDMIMQNIKTMLSTKGILSGSTVINNTNEKLVKQHKYEFKSMHDLR